MRMLLSKYDEVSHIEREYAAALGSRTQELALVACVKRHPGHGRSGDVMPPVQQFSVQRLV